MSAPPGTVRLREIADRRGVAGPRSITGGPPARVLAWVRTEPLALAAPALGLVFLVCGVPLGVLLVASFAGSDGFTFENYRRILASAAYTQIFGTTFLTAGILTSLSIVLGLPLSYALLILPRRLSACCMSLVMLPLWTSLLVRTYAWLVLLQRHGLVNDLLLTLRIIDQPLRLAYSWGGTMIGMLHIVLPLFILPMYAALKAVDRDCLRAAFSLGASPARVFWTVLLPLALSGVIGGLLLVFVYALGFYVTPDILGGGSVTLVAMKVQENAAVYRSWGPASSVGFTLLLMTLVLLLAAAWLLRQHGRTTQ